MRRSSSIPVSQFVQHPQRFFDYQFSGARREGRGFHLVSTLRIGAPHRHVTEAAVGVSRKQGVREGGSRGNFLAGLRERLARDRDQCDWAKPYSLQLPIDLGLAVIQEGSVRAHSGLRSQSRGSPYLLCRPLPSRPVKVFAQFCSLRFGNLRSWELLQRELQEPGSYVESGGLGLHSLIFEQRDRGAGCL